MPEEKKNQKFKWRLRMVRMVVVVVVVAAVVDHFYCRRSNRLHLHYHLQTILVETTRKKSTNSAFVPLVCFCYHLNNRIGALHT